jgi:hypothetical protein
MQVTLDPEAEALHTVSPGRQAGQELIQLICGRFASQAICLCAKLGIPDHLAAGTTTSAELATALLAQPASLRRFLAALASYRVVRETGPDCWTNTDLGNLLRRDLPGSLRGLACMFGARQHGESWLELEYSVRTGQSAFTKVHGADGWAYAQSDPNWNNVFNTAMSSLADAVQQAISTLYDFSRFDLVVDVGGGHGRLVAHLLKRFNRLRGIVFDQPHVVGGATEFLAAQHLADRCQAIGGDFLKSVPPGGDAYLMTAILHDWNDEACVCILQNCRQVMNPTGRILIADFILKPVNQPDLGRLIDLEMLIMTGSGRERSTTEFSELLEQSGLSLVQIIPLPFGNCLIEAEPR